MRIDPKDYYTHPNISQSDLWELKKSPVKYVEKKKGKMTEEEKDYFTLGSLIDCKLLTPDEFERRFILKPDSLKEPSSANQKIFCEKILVEGFDTVEAYKEGYKTGRKSEEKIKEEAEALKIEFDDYFQFMTGIDGREVYSTKQQAKMAGAIAAISKNEQAMELLLGRGKPHEIREAQVGLLWDLVGVNCRSLLDKLNIDPKAKVVENIDLKTTGKPLYFMPFFYRKYRYNFQQAFYALAAKAYLRHLGYDPKGWTIKTYCVAVETEEEFQECRVYEVPDEAIQDGLDDIKAAIQRYKFHAERNIWDRTMEEYLNNGIIKMEWRSYND